MLGDEEDDVFLDSFDNLPDIQQFFTQSQGKCKEERYERKDQYSQTSSTENVESSTLIGRFESVLVRAIKELSMAQIEALKKGLSDIEVKMENTISRKLKEEISSRKCNEKIDHPDANCLKNLTEENSKLKSQLALEKAKHRSQIENLNAQLQIEKNAYANLNEQFKLLLNDTQKSVEWYDKKIEENEKHISRLENDFREQQVAINKYKADIEKLKLQVDNRCTD